MIDPFIVVFDIETTDAQLSLPQVVEIGAIKLNPALEIIDDYETFVRPPNLEFFSEFSTQITGISRDQIETAPRWQEVWRSWAEFTKFKKCRLMSWGSFDTFLLRLEYHRLRLSYPHNDMPICIASMAYMHAYTRGWKPRGFSLKHICKEFGIEYRPNHRAKFDAALAVRVLRELVRPDKSASEPFKIYEV
tara:strand:- start:2762 stop:3334 length:573 start_codon:yes stop_codon:yes gene_type:complete